MLKFAYKISDGEAFGGLAFYQISITIVFIGVAKIFLKFLDTPLTPCKNTTTLVIQEELLKCASFYRVRGTQLPQ